MEATAKGSSGGAPDPQARAHLPLQIVHLGLHPAEVVEYF